MLLATLPTTSAPPRSISYRFMAVLAAALLFVLLSSQARAEPLRVEATMTVDLLDRVKISSSVEGVLQKIMVRTGQPIDAGKPLIQLDTARLKKQLLIAESEYRELQIKSENDGQERANMARQQMAQFNVDKLQEAAAIYQVSVPELEMTRAESELEAATAEREGTHQELAQYRAEAQAKQREIELLKYDIEKSSLASQYSGALSRIEKRPGEFVQKGETIAELYRLDRLTGVVLLNRDQLPPEEAANVTGKLLITGGAVERSYPITIKRVLPRVDVDGMYRAFVELENEKTQLGKWRLLPGIVGRAVFTRTAPAEIQRTETVKPVVPTKLSVIQP